LDEEEFGDFFRSGAAGDERRAETLGTVCLGFPRFLASAAGKWG